MALDYDLIRQQRLKGFGNEKQNDNIKINSIVSDLELITEQSKEDYPRISEQLFINRFLDAFYGAGISLEENYAIYLSWISDIAGNYNIPVHVCDNVTKNILFTVPSISNVNTINPAKAETREINNAVSIANESRFFQPNEWENLLQTNLDQVFKKIYDKEGIVTVEQNIWLSIFTRYKDILKDKKQLNSSQVSSNKEASSVLETFIEVDDPI